MQTLGLDIVGFPMNGTSPLSLKQTWSLPLPLPGATSKKTYIVGGISVVVSVGLQAEWGITDSLDVNATKLTVNAVPWINLTATAQGSVGVGIAGVEGSLILTQLQDKALVDFTFDNTPVVGPTAAGVHFGVTGDATSTELNGKLSVFVKAKFLWFKKKWSTTIARFSGNEQVTPYLDYHGCVTF